jgi:aminoglycoside 6'-N-acetyltransferase I
MQVRIRPITREDASIWERLRCALWPDGGEDHAPEIAAFFCGKLKEPMAVLLAEIQGGGIAAFAELSIRTDIPGHEAKRVGYVEGLYVIPELRHQGIARQLLQACRQWAREQECVAFASDRAERIVVDRTF